MNAIADFGMAKAIKELAATFRHKFDSDAEFSGYLKALSDLTADEVTSACEDLAKTERFWPRPSEIRKRVDALRRQNGRVLRPWSIPETVTDPTSGETVRAYACRDCMDTGWVLVQGIVRPGLDPVIAAQYRGARRCGCGKLREPSTQAFKGEGEQWQGEGR